jgi:hypothetical protein
MGLQDELPEDNPAGECALRLFQKMCYLYCPLYEISLHVTVTLLLPITKLTSAHLS